jgi:hypothetical protein
MLNRLAVSCAGLAVLVLVAAPHVSAGTIGLSWQPSPGASGYRVHYGPQSNNLSTVVDVGNTTQTTLNSLGNCTTWHFAVSAYNAAGSSNLSPTVSSWPRPSVSNASPASAKQGTQLTLTINGNNFDPQVELELDNPNVLLANATVLCDRIQVAATVLPLPGGGRAAEVGRFTVTVTNPHDLTAARADAFEVLVDPARQDLDKSVPSTDDRIDGLDFPRITWLFSPSQGSCTCCQESCPNFDYDRDINGDGWIDGEDLAYVTNSFFGRCWDAAAKVWTAAACASHPSQL